MELTTDKSAALESAAKDKASIRKVVGASMAGTVAEWYEFFIYGIASTLVFSKLFFPSSGVGVSVFDGIIAAFATYAVGFLARPIGGLVFGHFGDKYGRKKLLQISLILVGASTFLIGCIPGYASIGYMAPVLLVILRFIQGFAVGGEWGGAMLLVSEHSDEKRRGFYSSFLQAAAPAGSVAASLVLLTLSMTLPEESFLAWGWRVAFWLSAVIIIIGYYIRKNVEESDVFKASLEKQEATRKSSAGLKEVLKYYPKQAICGMLMRVGENSAYYIIVVFSITYLSVQHHIGYTTMLLLLLCANTFHFFAMIFGGHLSDKFGRKNIMMFGYVGILLWMPFYFHGLDQGSFAVTLFAMCVGLFFQGVTYSGQGAVLAEIFPTRMRYSGVSFCYQVAGILAGSIAPMIATMLWKEFGSTLPVIIYILSISVMSMIAIFLLKESKHKSLKEIDLEDRKNIA
ncbi:MFS transporter [Acinetobacter sp. WCHAc010052]|uniref:MFS transporter n=1 Tax=Acinetobacter sp. WCHAc010052 TaxID=2004647 RepID=UPI000B3C99BB|nr:MFS transporter [Acinetobacter sp. WCHAc010052]AXY59681.1 MFS transporter [Acinetobacter sp. WCHAc010052]